ncbi:MAG: diaminopimelate epimerase [Nitrospirae bacterium RBG_13_43_8]|nr:MAG: diaminopimelate epimerase [Nitrospirae bacterium RBG_13_43_8]
MPFTKMHGLGNDFILIDCRHRKFDNLHELSKTLCHRRFGVGADQMLLLFDSRNVDFMMRIFNADGDEVEMCGNGIRCLARYIWDRNFSDKKILSIETLGGIIRPERSGDMVRVDMGEPVFDPEKIPVKMVQSSKFKVESLKTQNATPIIDYPLRIKDREFKITCVSMGNPHAVIFVENLSQFPVPYYGSLIEDHFLFPKKTNVEFIEVLTPREIKMRVWERGSGETMACGTGASAAAVASNMKGLTERDVTVHLIGGDLIIEWAGNNHIYMTGPAVEVFEGIINI